MDENIFDLKLSRTYKKLERFEIWNKSEEIFNVKDWN